MIVYTFNDKPYKVFDVIEENDESKRVFEKEGKNEKKNKVSDVEF